MPSFLPQRSGARRRACWLVAMRPGNRRRQVPAIAVLGICLASTVVQAAGPAGSGCAWGPITDVPAAQALIQTWAAATNLPPFDRDKSGLGIDRSSARLRLQFTQGTLTVAWELGDDCQPTAITMSASLDYDGARPGAAAVKQLVASLRAVTVEQRVGPPPWRYPGVVLLVTAGAVLTALLSLVGWRVRAAGVEPGEYAAAAVAHIRDMPTSSWVRLLGLLGIVALLPYQAVPPGPGPAFNLVYANSVIVIGILPVVAFLWLVFSGYFGYGSSRREDWVALLTALLALGIREGYARHAIEEIEIHFFHGSYGIFPNRHSVIYPLFQMFLQPLARDPYLFIMHVNGILGALAALPLYLFVRQRTNNRMAAALVATFFAVHPIIVQMAPTDGQYSLLLFTWFAGLALLTADDIGARQIFGGAVLLGIAATCRAEGSLFLVASILLLDLRALGAAVRRHVGATVLACGVVLGLVALHVYICFPVHVRRGGQLPNIGSFTLTDVFRAGLLSDDFNDRVFVALVGVGALAGLVNKRLRIGLGAALGTLVVVWPVSMTTTGGFTILHRLVPVCAVQVIAAGIGAAWLTNWLPSRLRQHWAAALPALAVAFYLFATHRHEIRDPNALTDEFWMLRNHLAPHGVVNQECTLLSVGRAMDTDIHDFSQVLPGMSSARCEQEDCIGIVSKGGCFYYVRSVNCFFSEVRTAPECLERGRTSAGDLLRCIDPRCAQLERALELSTVEERTVDVYNVFHGLPDRPQWPRVVDIGLYRVVGMKQ